MNLRESIHMRRFQSHTLIKVTSRWLLLLMKRRKKSQKGNFLKINSKLLKDLRSSTTWRDTTKSLMNQHTILTLTSSKAKLMPLVRTNKDSSNLLNSFFPNLISLSIPKRQHSTRQKKMIEGK